jgi:hypothetical protein
MSSDYLQLYRTDAYNKALNKQKVTRMHPNGLFGSRGALSAVGFRLALSCSEACNPLQRSLGTLIPRSSCWQPGYRRLSGLLVPACVRGPALALRLPVAAMRR